MTNATLTAFRELAETTTETTPSRYRVKPWPNHLGFEVFAGNQMFEVWEHGTVVRQKKANNICGVENVEWYKTGRMCKTAAEATIAVNEAIRAKNWTPCGQ